MDGTQITYKAITESLSDELQALNKILSQALESDDTPLMNEIVRTYLLSKGKQIRPVMVMLCARLFGRINERVLHAAASLELLHNASLIHDDVVDDTRQRRGRDTINALWDNHIAVLVGDFFVSGALAEAVNTGSIEIVSSLSALGKELSKGEIHQICNARDHSFQTTDYFTAIDKKTASLFMHCALVGALAAGAHSADTAPLLEYATKLGLCFQIRDDIFDYFPAQKTGKPSGNDLREGKVTLPLLLALQRAPESEAAPMKQILQSSLPTDAQIEELTAFAHRHGGIEAAYEAMADIHRSAMPLLSHYPESEARDSLEALFAYIIAREN